FSAEVRHLKGATPCHVGLFFALRQLGEDAVKAPFFVRVFFDDVHDAGERHDRVLAQLGDDVPEDLKGKPRPLNGVNLNARLHLGTGWVGGGVEGPTAHFGSFQASKGVNPAWRRLLVEVMPERIRAWLGDDEKGAVTLSPADLAQGANEAMRQVPQMSVTSPLPLDGGVGLIVDDGVASFRRVVLTRLPALTLS